MEGKKFLVLMILGLLAVSAFGWVWYGLSQQDLKDTRAELAQTQIEKGLSQGAARLLQYLQEEYPDEAEQEYDDELLSMASGSRDATDFPSLLVSRGDETNNGISVIGVPRGDGFVCVKVGNSWMAVPTSC